METFDRLFIGGELVTPAGNEVFEVRYPATEELVGSAPAATVADIDRAVAAARRAFDTGPWPQLSVDERADLIAAAIAIISDRSPELDALVTRENGIPVINGHAKYAVLAAEPLLAAARAREMVESRPTAGGHAVVRKVPVGVVGAIVPWNGPLMQALGKLVPALVNGCTVVLKPAPETPLDSYALAEAFTAVGLPPGVVNIVAADREVGEHLVRHPDVDKIAFTGSTVAGRRIGAICGEQIKRLTLELGGKSAAVLLDDIDIDVVAPQLALGGFFYSGQACSALTRVLAPRSRYDDVVAALVSSVEALPYGDPLDPGIMIGPLAAERQRTRVEDYVSSGTAQGAKAVLGGSRPTDRPKGWWFEPTVFADVDNTMRIAQEEIFGPVVCVIPYDGEDDAVNIANDSQYGLAGAVFSRDVVHATSVADRIRAGNIGANCIGMEMGTPVGGFKASGIGREFSAEVLDEYSELKTVCVAD
jgi:aldehyde dehydrogenase (NAD+)